MINVVKIGGNVVDNAETLSQFIRVFSELPSPKILIHGGGKEATRMSTALGLGTNMVDGRRITDAATLDVVTMVYAGLVNKRIVSKLQQAGVDALGLSGADANSIMARRRSPNPVDYGYVGDIERVNTAFLKSLLENGIVPVFCAIMHDGCGSLLNCNADSVASAVAVAMSEVEPVNLIYCFEKPGVLTDAEDDTTVIPVITKESYESLRTSGVVSGGMIPKIDNAFASIEKGVDRVIIKHACKLDDPYSGTIIRP